MPLIQLAPKVLVFASEVQLVLGLYEAISGLIKGDRIAIYQTIINIIRTKLTPSQCDMIISSMKTAVSVLEYAEVVKDVLAQIIQQYDAANGASARTLSDAIPSANISGECDQAIALQKILQIADRSLSQLN